MTRQCVSNFLLLPSILLTPSFLRPSPAGSLGWGGPFRMGWRWAGQTPSQVHVWAPPPPTPSHSQLTCSGGGSWLLLPLGPRDLSSPPASCSPIPPGGEKAGFRRCQRAQAPSRGLLLPTFPSPSSSGCGSVAALLPGTAAWEPQFLLSQKQSGRSRLPGPASLWTS